MTPSVPPPYTVHAPTWDDFQAVADLIAACDADAYGRADYSAEDLTADWHRADFDLARDAYAVVDGSGRVAAYAEVWANQATHLQAVGVVHPEHRGQGLGTALLSLVEARAGEMERVAPAGLRVTIFQGILGNDTAAATLLRRHGYAEVRRFSRMEIVLGREPAPPVWPAGVEMRPYVPGRDDRALFQATEEAFADHWGHLPQSFERWIERRHGHPDYDPSLWLVAWDGDEIAGSAICRNAADGGEVDLLSVRARWRNMGLGTALLAAAFEAFHRRGVQVVRLGVDSESLTGATRLYERAGMRVERQYAILSKVLRDGAELSTQPL